MKFNTLFNMGSAVCNYTKKQNQWFTVTNYTLEKGLNKPFKVLCLSDLHDAQFGTDNCVLLATVKSIRPDVVVLTGDTVSTGADNLSSTCEMLKKLCEISPVFAILGNHENRRSQSTKITQAFEEAGVIVLKNELWQGEINKQTISILGLWEQQGLSKSDYAKSFAGTLKYENHLTEVKALSKSDGIRILLSHFPENFSMIGELSYCQRPFEVMFSGHAHGGQWRLPYVGGLYSPGQGIFPRFDGGFYKRANNALVVSRGLGNDVPVPRINNRPEIVVLTVV